MRLVWVLSLSYASQLSAQTKAGHRYRSYVLRLRWRWTGAWPKPPAWRQTSPKTEAFCEINTMHGQYYDGFITSFTGTLNTRFRVASSRIPFICRHMACGQKRFFPDQPEKDPGLMVKLTCWLNP